MHKISIIVPVYNVRPYIEQCLHSIQRQTHDNLEIILVNDGSTDGSGAICDMFASRDSRFKVIHQENRGVSAARNAGLDIASGQYIGFVDPDDVIFENYFGTLLFALLENNGDITVSSVQTIDDKGDPSYMDRVSREIYEGDGPILDWLLNKMRHTSVWGKLHTLKLWGNTRFPVDLTLNEDVAISTAVCISARRIISVPEAVYQYRIRNDSLSNGAISPKRTREALQGIELAGRQLLERYPAERQKIKAHISGLKTHALIDGLISLRYNRDAKTPKRSTLHRVYTYIEELNEAAKGGLH